jgi:hypothetical protein
MKKPKVLVYDIETSPNLAYVWGKYDQDVIDYEKEWQLLSVAWKWLGEKKAYVKSVKDAKELSDKALCKRLWELFDKADVIVAHNGDQFDQKKVRSRFLFWGFPPPKPFVSVDTRKVARKYFKFNSNKLDDLGAHLGLGRKIRHPGFAMWKGCMAGDTKSFRQMEKYNKQDVILLEKIYLCMRPWMDNHPSVALLRGHEGCPNCGSKKCIRKGLRATHRTIKQQWVCKDCNSWHLTPVRKVTENE